MLKVNRINKSKVTDPTMVDDVTYLNYLALAGAILLDPESEDYKQIVFNKELYDKDEELKRIKEIDDIRARGEMTELEYWYKYTLNKKDKKDKIKSEKELLRIEKIRQSAILNARERQIKRLGLFEKFKDEIFDVSNMESNEISKHKIKVINIESGEIQYFDTKKECEEHIGIESRNIIQYIKRKAVFNKKYIFTISNEKSSKIYNNRTRIKAVNIKTGEEKIFNKFREASDFYGYVYITFMQKFRKGQLSIIGDWELEEI